MREAMKKTLHRLLGGRESGAVNSLESLVRDGLATVGEGSYGEPDVQSWDRSTRLTIGAYCLIAHGVRIILGGEHRTATGATILSGVTIGDGSVIGAGAVVADDVPAYTIVAANDAAR